MSDSQHMHCHESILTTRVKRSNQTKKGETEVSPLYYHNIVVEKLICGVVVSWNTVFSDVESFVFFLLVNTHTHDELDDVKERE